MAISGATPYLWFDDQALEAAEFYVSIFPDSRLGAVQYYLEGSPRPARSVLLVEFELMGRPFAALNGGPQFPHTEAVSFEVRCDTQEEIDRVWDALVANGGQESQCGWCKDRFGVNWQVTPTVLVDLLAGPDRAAAQRAWDAVMDMRRIVIADLLA
jgi:predicted 3-demethylubiquinone-9 3-methyltransferase (glyoxalase superfamily)